MKQTILIVLHAMVFAAVSCQSIPPVCTGRNEVFTDCGSACPRTCASIREPNKNCIQVCVAGCFCRAGFVRNTNGVCVRPRDCPPQVSVPNSCTRPNEEFRPCGSVCPPSCPRFEPELNKCLNDSICVSGCFCKAGFVRGFEGSCVNPLQCPQILEPRIALVPAPIECIGPNEQFTECVGCPDTCESLGKPPRPCPRVCRSGCICSDGFVRNLNGICVLVKDCPQKKCNSPDEEFRTCGSACPPKCPRIGLELVKCPTGCVSGCFCKAGLVRNFEGVCVNPLQCPQISQPRLALEAPTMECSGLNEQFKECMGCPDSCDTLGKPRPCPFICQSGCTCSDGFVRNSTGVCVLIEDCPQNKCSPDEEFQECGSACPPRCSRFGLELAKCPPACVSACFCKDGLVRNFDGTCVNASQCPQTLNAECIGPNEEFKECVGCPATCESLGKPPRPCPRICRPGCTCSDGFARNMNRKCVPVQDCPQNKCSSPDEEFRACGSACPPRCPRIGLELVNCPTGCVSGCFCKPGLVRNYEGVCVQPWQCPQISEPRIALDVPTTECSGPNEQFSDCVRCPDTCESLGEPPRPCPRICRSGCICSDGFVRNRSGLCVRPTECTSVFSNCSRPNEEFRACGTRCFERCPSIAQVSVFRPGCSDVCVSGCFCKTGFKRDFNERCVALRECPPVKILPRLDVVACSGPNEQWNGCGSSCPETCESLEKPPMLCPAVCQAGCFCSDGFVRNATGLCVHPSECPSCHYSADVRPYPQAQEDQAFV